MVEPEHRWKASSPSGSSCSDLGGGRDRRAMGHDQRAEAESRALQEAGGDARGEGRRPRRRRRSAAAGAGTTRTATGSGTGRAVAGGMAADRAAGGRAAAGAAAPAADGGRLRLVRPPPTRRRDRRAGARSSRSRLPPCASGPTGSAGSAPTCSPSPAPRSCCSARRSSSTVAISDGWLTPGRQVALAVLGGIVVAILAVRTHDARRPGARPARPGAGRGRRRRRGRSASWPARGSTTTQVVSTPAALIGTGFAAAFMVALRLALARPGDGGARHHDGAPGAAAGGRHGESRRAPRSSPSRCVVAGFVTVRRAWPWLVACRPVADGLAARRWWLVDQTDRFAEGTAPRRSRSA